MSERISISDQAVEAEVSAANLRGHIDNIRNLVARNKRPAHELTMLESRLPAVEAGAKTLRAIASSERMQMAMREAAAADAAERKERAA